MQVASPKSVRLVETSTIRTAIETTRALQRLADRYPSFVHKWTREKRVYLPEELSLPKILRVRGDLANWEFPVVGVGGTRSPTVETFNLVSLVVRALAKEEVRIISGGVPGVDLAAHLAAADDPASATFVVLANPPELGLCGHEWSSTILENQILRRGAFLSEYSEQRDLETIEFRERLLARDRIISGLCDLFLVFECREDSATVDTARRAIAQGKEVLCIQSAQESVRRGIGQLAHEFLIPIFDERTDSHATIVNGILARIMKVAESLV